MRQIILLATLILFPFTLYANTDTHDCTIEPGIATVTLEDNSPWVTYSVRTGDAVYPNEDLVLVTTTMCWDGNCNSDSLEQPVIPQGLNLKGHFKFPIPALAPGKHAIRYQIKIDRYGCAATADANFLVTQ